MDNIVVIYINIFFESHTANFFKVNTIFTFFNLGEFLVSDPEPDPEWREKH